MFVSQWLWLKNISLKQVISLGQFHWSIKIRKKFCWRQTPGTRCTEISHREKVLNKSASLICSANHACVKTKQILVSFDSLCIWSPGGSIQAPTGTWINYSCKIVTSVSKVEICKAAFTHWKLSALLQTYSNMS